MNSSFPGSGREVARRNGGKAGYNGDATATAFGDVSTMTPPAKWSRKSKPRSARSTSWSTAWHHARRHVAQDVAGSWHAVLSTNLYSVFQHLQARDRRHGRGAAGATSSTFLRSMASRGQFGQTNYAAAKAGVGGFTKSLAQEVIPQRRDRERRVTRLHRHRHDPRDPRRRARTNRRIDPRRPHGLSGRHRQCHRVLASGRIEATSPARIFRSTVGCTMYA